MAVSVNMTVKRPDEDGGKKLVKKLSHINPDSTNTNISKMVTALNSLSKNSLEDVEKFKRTKVDFSQI